MKLKLVYFTFAWYQSCHFVSWNIFKSPKFSSSSCYSESLQYCIFPFSSIHSIYDKEFCINLRFSFIFDTTSCIDSFAPDHRRLWKSSHVEKSLHQLDVTWFVGISFKISFIILILWGLGLLKGPISKWLRKVRKPLFSCFSSTIIECLIEIL